MWYGRKWKCRVWRCFKFILVYFNVIIIKYVLLKDEKFRKDVKLFRIVENRFKLGLF